MDDLRTHAAELESQSQSSFGISVESLALFLAGERTTLATEVHIRPGFAGSRYKELEQAGYVKISSRDRDGPPRPGSDERIMITATPKGEALWAAFRRELPADRPVYN